jgi:hypothetical protein
MITPAEARAYQVEIERPHCGLFQYMIDGVRQQMTEI